MMYSEETLRREFSKYQRNVDNLTKEDRKKYYKIMKALGYYRAIRECLEGVEISEPSVEWYTPKWFFDKYLYPFYGQKPDLDPASNITANLIVGADRFFDKVQNGLVREWWGKVFCNPPYGNMTKQFLEKGLQEFWDGDLDEIVFLVNRSQALWYKAMLPNFTVCEVRRRIAFMDINGVIQKSPRYHNDILYLGCRKAEFIEIFGKLGVIK